MMNLIPLVLVHGISRNVHQHIQAFSEFARQTGRMLIAPLFDEIRCKRYQQVRTKQCRADQMLLAVLQDARRLSGHHFKQVMLYGFSGGAQFGHRFAMLYPGIVSQLAIASAGWYTFPDHQQTFPYGIRSSAPKGRCLTQNLKQFLSIPMLVMAGELDIRRDANLRKGKDIDRQQGRSRVERAARWVRAMRSQAQIFGVQPNISLTILPDSSHDFNRCVKRGNMVTCVTDWLTTSIND
ncbi:MAG: hypothetical protein ACPGSM_14435 [Thiolinea sp.]